MTSLDDATLFLSVRELSDQIRSRALSPVTLTEGYLRRLERIGGAFNAVVTLTRDLALEQARRAEEEIAAGRYRGPLHGVPYGAKDLLATKGIATTWGAAPCKTQRFDFDATVVKKLEDAGAILVAKLAMVELAGGLGYRYASASFTGPGRNPWNTGRWTGGSSSGSGAAAAAGLVGFAIGSETWGSIVTPAAFCGVSGLRPTYGRVSRHGAMALSWTMDKIGVLARTADDCGLVLNAIAGPDPSDPTTIDKPWRYAREAEPRAFKLGVVRKAFEKVEPEVKSAFDEALRRLDGVAAVEDVTLPEFPYDAVAVTIISAEASSAFEDLIESGRVSGLTDALGQVGGFSSSSVFAKDYLKALRLRGRLMRLLDDLLSTVDAIVAPTLPVVASPIEADLFTLFSFSDPVGGGGNAAGLPAISVPCGFGKDRLPAGIQFVGRAGSENRILAVASAFQQRTAWHRERPPEPRKE